MALIVGTAFEGLGTDVITDFNVTEDKIVVAIALNGSNTMATINLSVDPSVTLSQVEVAIVIV